MCNDLSVIRAETIYAGLPFHLDTFVTLDIYIYKTVGCLNYRFTKL